MTTNVISHSAIQSASRTATALRSLMQIWEEDLATEEGESETDLMVLLSGMVNPAATSIGE
jgi:hypothetical protein